MAVYMTEKALKEAGDKVNLETKKTVEEKIAALKNYQIDDFQQKIKENLELRDKLENIKFFLGPKNKD
jgi:molecular chaperone DnaK (HSP70)